MVATWIGSRKMAEMWAPKSSFSIPHSSHPGCTVIIPKTSEQSQFEKDGRKAGENGNPKGAQMNHNAVEKWERSLSKSTELGEDNPGKPSCFAELCHNGPITPRSQRNH